MNAFDEPSTYLDARTPYGLVGLMNTCEVSEQDMIFEVEKRQISKLVKSYLSKMTSETAASAI